MLLVGISVAMIAVGAMLRWGTDASAAGVELGTVGIVLMVFGAVGAFTELVLDAERGGERSQPRRRARHAGTFKER